MEETGTDIFRLRIAGVSFRQKAVYKVKVGDKVILEPEPTNQYDKNAIKVIANGHWIGYIPQKQTEILHEAISAGCSIITSVHSVGLAGDSDILGVIIAIAVTYPSTQL